MSACFGHVIQTCAQIYCILGQSNGAEVNSHYIVGLPLTAS